MTAPASKHAAEPRVAIWGTFDVANFGDHLFPRIFEHEVQRRLPNAIVQPFAPLGHLHPLSLDGGRVVEPLGEWRPERLEELAGRFDLVAIGGGEIIHAVDDAFAGYYDTSVEEARRLRPSAFFAGGLGRELQKRHGAAWHAVGIPFELESDMAELVRGSVETMAYVSVREHISRERLERAGVTREIRVVPDSAFLVRRIVTAKQLERRLRLLRELRSYPESEPPLVVQGSRALLGHIDAIAASLEGIGDIPILLLETGACHGDATFADALAERLDRQVWRMPPSPTIEDIVTAIVHSRGFAGISLHGNIIALASGVPNAIFDLGVDFSKLLGMARLVGCEGALVRSPAEIAPAIERVLSRADPWKRLPETIAEVDKHFDTLADLASRSVSGRIGGDEPTMPEHKLRRAFDARGRRLVEQRLRLADQVGRLEASLADSEARASELATRAATAEEDAARLRRELQWVSGELESVHGELESVRGELESLRATKTFRHTAKLRGMYSLLRGSRD